MKSDWLTPSAGQSPTKASCSKASPRKTRAAIAASATAAAAAAAAAAAQAASDLLTQSGSVTPRKIRKPPSAASTQKTSKAKSSAASGEGEDQHNAKEHIASVPCSEGEDQHDAKNSKKNYAPRGSKGTFAGRRPPKNPALLAQFLEDKKEYMDKKERERLQKQAGKQKKQKRRYSAEQENYRAFQRTFDRSTSSSSRVSFIEAAAAWQVEKARRVAEQASSFF